MMLKSKDVELTCLVNENDDLVLTRLSSLLGREPSSLMNEALRELIRKYNPSRSFCRGRLRLVKR